MNIKDLVIMCVVMSVGTASAMKRSVEKNFFDLDTADHCATFKSLKGFPLTSLNKGTQWFVALSDSDKNSVTQIVINHNDERLKALFNIVTKLPFDLQKVIAGYLYNDDKQMNNFMGMPIRQAYCYGGSLDILDDENNRNFAHQYWITPEPRMKPDVMCNIAKDITVFCSKPLSGKVRKKNELEAIAKVVKAFQGSIPDGDRCGASYEYSEQLTCKRFIQKDLRYLPFCLSAFISLALPWLDVCGVNEHNLRFNKVADDFNAAALRAYEATGSEGFLKSRVKARDEHEYCLSPFLYMKAASWLSAIIPAYDVITEIKSRPMFLAEQTTMKDVGCFAAGAFFLMMINAIAEASQRVDQPTLGASCVTGLYFLACAVYNKVIKEHTKQAWVAYNKLPELLQRTDIEIV